MLRDAQGLNGKLTTLNRFISNSVEKAMPLFITLKGCIEKNNFCWTLEAKAALHQIKKVLHTLPILSSRIPGETLQMYLLASNEAISLVLVVEKQGKQLPIYFVNRVLQGPKLSYPIIEKLVLTLVYAA